MDFRQMKKEIDMGKNIQPQKLWLFRRIRGSFSLEVALIVPFIIYILISFIFLSYFLYDKCRIEEELQNQFLAGNRWILHETKAWGDDFAYQRLNERGVLWDAAESFETQREAWEEQWEKGTKKYFQTTLSDVAVMVDQTHMQLAYTETKGLPNELLRFFCGTEKSRTREENFHCPADFTRKYTVFRRLISENQVLSDLKEGLVEK